MIELNDDWHNNPYKQEDLDELTNELENILSTLTDEISYLNTKKINLSVVRKMQDLFTIGNELLELLKYLIKHG